MDGSFDAGNRERVLPSINPRLPPSQEALTRRERRRHLRRTERSRGAVLGLCCGERGLLQLWRTGFSLRRFLWLQRVGSRHMAIAVWHVGSVAEAPRL